MLLAPTPRASPCIYNDAPAHAGCHDRCRIASFVASRAAVTYDATLTTPNAVMNVKTA
ncbi:hypothetical protein XAP412_770051 [Xanthomonas phaseoli pv. phaseoli]|uniref:Uncharacterized protein n=1 Tax=Xanthomonas campestris pv. phaseoli TaxID=317013 RepID=A0AB38E6L2_XANCH|nr:hypothetical protein XAP6984_810053 [Xanthomonas phaseoli pv. phaseoli]SON90249.1 hypothetical protein XAP412_770051 [Xanthomonas phaseoli pv. phaseoli]SON92495.1 hypothetical protein XAP7430_770053 [Xanthomonas phaseoli pv. phaseoli]